MFLKLINYLLLFPAYLLVLFLSIIIKIRIKEIPTKRIGHLIIENNNYLNKKKIQKFFSLDLFFTETSTCNKFLLNLLKDKLIILPRYILGPILNMNRRSRLILKKIPSFEFPNDYFVPRDLDNFIELNKKNFTISEDLKLKGKTILDKINIKENDKIVCLILRDSQYLKETFNKNFDYHAYRDIKIEKFKKTTEYLIQNHYVVIRMGTVVKEKFPLVHDRFIDYPFSNIKNEFMDFYLGDRCEFTISSGTGWHEIPTILNKPIVHITGSLGTYSSYKKNNIFLTKKYKKGGQYLNLREIFRLGIPYFTSVNQFIENDIQYEDCDENQILATVKQMINLIDKKFILDPKDEELQNKFRQLFDEKKLDVNQINFHKKILSNYNQDSLKIEFNL